MSDREGMDIVQITNKDLINLLRPGIQRYVNDILNVPSTQDEIVDLMKQDKYADIIALVGRELLKKVNRLNGTEQ